MKITKSEFARLIKESVMKKLQEQDELGDTELSRSQQQKVARDKLRDTTRTTGITKQELGLIDKLETMLTDTAKETNLLSGDVKTRLMQLMKVLQKILGPAADKEADQMDDAAAVNTPEAGGEPQDTVSVA